jgi:septal ring factor EnvC (AmiA/AmiB activator)
VSETEDRGAKGVEERADPDRVWRVARWVVAVPVFIVSVAVLVISAFALYFAHKTSTEDLRAGIARTYSNVQKQLSESEQLIKQANQTLSQLQENAKDASSDASKTQASLNASLRELQQSLDQANRALVEGAKTQQEILNELSTVSKQLDAIELAESKLATSATETVTTTG